MKIEAPKGPKHWATLEQAAEYLACSTATVRRRIADGSLPAYRLGRTQSLRVKYSDLEALLLPVPTLAVGA